MMQLKKSLVSLALCAGSFLPFSQAASAQEVDLSSPEKTIRSFLDMVNKSSAPLRPLSELGESRSYEARAAAWSRY